MTGYQDKLADARGDAMRRRNRRTGLVLASIALIFFIGIIVKYTFG
ncbi:MAG: cytochrome oxidase small assembly protein [Burkholderiaceae bacterium]